MLVPQDDFICGTPSVEKSPDLWKCFLTDSEVPNEEFDRVWEELTGRLATIGKVGYGKGCDFVLDRGNRGDRTQYLQMVNPDALTPTLINHLQSWLSEPVCRQYRVEIVIYNCGPATFTIDPKHVCLGQGYDENNLPETLQRIVAEMKEAPGYRD